MITELIKGKLVRYSIFIIIYHIAIIAIATLPIGIDADTRLRTIFYTNAVVFGVSIGTLGVTLKKNKQSESEVR
jgi:hypothetical protein